MGVPDRYSLGTVCSSGTAEYLHPATWCKRVWLDKSVFTKKTTTPASSHDSFQSPNLHRVNTSSASVGASSLTMTQPTLLSSTSLDLELTARSLATHETVESLASALQPHLDNALSSSAPIVQQDASRASLREQAIRHVRAASTKNVAWLFKRHRKLVPLVHAVVRIQAEEQRLASQQNTGQQLAHRRWQEIRKAVDSVNRKSEKSRATIVQRLKSTLDKLEGMRRGNASQAHISQPSAPSQTKDKSPAMTKTLKRKRARQARSRAKKSEARERTKLKESRKYTSPKVGGAISGLSLRHDETAQLALPLAEPVLEQSHPPIHGLRTLTLVHRYAQDAAKAGVTGDKRGQSAEDGHGARGQTTCQPSKKAKMTDAWVNCNGHGHDID